MLKLILDVGQPWLRASGVALYVLLVREIILGLRKSFVLESCNSEISETGVN
jgi:hypothetical protein